MTIIYILQGINITCTVELPPNIKDHKVFIIYHFG